MSISFDGSAGKYLSRSDTFGLSGDGARTVLCWVKPANTTVAKSPYLLLCTGTSVASGVSFWDDATFQSEDRDGAVAIPTGSYSSATWYCYFAKRPAGAGTATYTAGVAASGATSFTTGTDATNGTETAITELRIGERYSGRAWNGLIGVWRAWSVQLTQGELEAELTATGIAPVKTANLVADYRFLSTGSGLLADSIGSYTLSATGGGGTYDADVPAAWSGASAPLAQAHYFASLRKA